MENTYYKTKKDNYAVIIGTEGIFFSGQGILSITQDVDFIKSTLLELEGNDKKMAEKIYDEIKDYQVLEEKEGIEFFLNKKTFKIFAIIDGAKVELEKAELKDDIILEKKKLKNFLKGIRKSKDSYKFGDRILLYGPTGTGKTYNFIEWLKIAKIDFSIVPVSEGMEDVDFFNRIIPGATGISYKEKEICKLLDKAEKGEKVCIVFDELNRGNNSFMNMVLKALDAVDGKNYHLTDIVQDRTYIIPIDNIVWGATINLGGKYTGTNALDEALFDRFNLVKYVGYNLDVERTIIKSGVSDLELVKKIINFVSDIREYAEGGEIRAPISTRGIKVWIEEYINNNDIIKSFVDTLLYRLVKVDEFGNPNQEDVGIIDGKMKEYFS